MSSSVSVVIPTHNRAHLLGAAIDSALAQTSPPEEIIVVDDGSTDGTAELVRSFTRKNVRYVWQARRERSAARNVGIDLARTPWIAFLDSDDFWDANHLECLERAARPNVAAVYSGFRQSRGPGQPNLRSIRDGRSGDLFQDIAFERVSILTSGAMVRRDALRAVSGFPLDLNIGEDWVVFLKLAARWLFASSGEATTVLREHSGRSMRDGALVCQDAPRAAEIALRDPEVARRLGTLEPAFLARRDLSIAVKLRATDSHAEARRFLARALLADARIALDGRFPKTLVRSCLPVALNHRITALSEHVRQRVAAPLR